MNKLGLWIWATVLALALAGAASGQGINAQAAPVEMPIRSGSIVVKVAAYEDARCLVLAAARSQGAEMLGARTLVDVKGRRHGWLRLRLPAPRLPSLLSAVGAAGKLYGKNVTTSDHASEYEELARRITRLHEHEARLSGILGDGRRVRGGDLLYVQERLFRASVDESLLAQRRADLERDTQVNTLMVELFEPGSLPAPAVGGGPTDPAQWFPQALVLARTHLSRLLARGATGAAYVPVYAPLWLPAVFVFFLLLRWLWNHRARFAARLRSLLRGYTGIIAPPIPQLLKEGADKGVRHACTVYRRDRADLDSHRPSAFGGWPSGHALQPRQIREPPARRCAGDTRRPQGLCGLRAGVFGQDL